MKSLKSYQESLERYKKFYPENCVGRDDIEILLFRKVITEHDAFVMRYGHKPEDGFKMPKPKRDQNKPKEKRVRPYTSNQIRKMCLAATKDWVGDCPGMNIEDAAYDMAEAMLFNDERMKEYFRRSGVQPKYWKESLADYFVP